MFTYNCRVMVCCARLKVLRHVCFVWSCCCWSVYPAVSVPDDSTCGFTKSQPNDYLCAFNDCLYSPHLALSSRPQAFYFSRDDVALPGFACFFKENSHEEREHAEKLMAFQNNRGGRIFLQDVKVSRGDLRVARSKFYFWRAKRDGCRYFPTWDNESILFYLFFYGQTSSLFRCWTSPHVKADVATTFVPYLTERLFV